MPVTFLYDKKEPVPFYYLVPSRWSGELPPPYDSSLLPQHFLEFAIKDLDDTDPRGLVNAFGNAKKALHFMIDSLLDQYGAFTHYRKANFPVKLALLDAIGILPITIMKNLNVERNLLEHEYLVPSRRRVEEAVDVAKLILMAAERVTERIPIEVIVGWRKPRRHLVMQLEPILGELRFYGLRASGQYHKIGGVNCFRGPLRSFFGDQLSDGILVSKSPWQTIPIRKGTENAWRPILRELVNIQRRDNERASRVNRELATITVPVTIPLADIPQTSWAELLDTFLAQSRSNKEKKDKDTEKSKKTSADLPKKEVEQ